MSGSELRASRVGAVATAVVLAGISVAFVGVEASQAVGSRCLGKDATITGTDGPDHIFGTPGADVIVGLGANDEISGGGGNDRICGGGGSDVLFGGEGRDRLAGQSDPRPRSEPSFASGDTLAGGKGDDVLYGGRPGVDDRTGDAVSFRGSDGGVDVNLAAGESHGQGDDRLVGIEDIIGSTHADSLRAAAGGQIRAGRGDDRIASMPGPERLQGGRGEDHLVLGAGDFGYGNAGDDVLRMRPAGEAAAEGDGGDDTFVGGAGRDIFYDFAPHGGQDHARGHGGDDLISLGSGADVAAGGTGRDVIAANPGADRADGGKGRDRFSGGFLVGDGGLMVNLRLGTATGAGTGVDQLTSFADIDGTAGNDVLIGNEFRNDIFAGPGNDRMFGGAGDDSLDGHVGRDRADGGPGDDTCTAEQQSRCED